MWYKKSLILSIAFLFQFVFAGLGFAQNTTNVSQTDDDNDADASYVIFDRDKQLISGDWEEVDSDLVWNFE